MQDVAVGVFEGGDPASPVFVFRRSQELDTGLGESAVLPVYVFHAKVGHHAVRVFGGAADTVVDADVEAHVLAQLEGYIVAVVGMKRQMQKVMIKPVKLVQIVCPDCYADYTVGS